MAIGISRRLLSGAWRVSRLVPHSPPALVSTTCARPREGHRRYTGCAGTAAKTAQVQRRDQIGYRPGWWMRSP